MNKKVSLLAAKSADTPVPLGQAGLKEMLCLEHERTAAGDYVIRLECRLFQLLKAGKVLP